MVWQGKLGSYAEKVERLRALAGGARPGGRAPRELLPTVERAALLAKADLVTGMVGEFPELQGVMGREYALASGEPPRWRWPSSSTTCRAAPADALPTGDAGALVGSPIAWTRSPASSPSKQAAQRLGDPFGLRRACLGVIHLVLGRGLPPASLGRSAGPGARGSCGRSWPKADVAADPGATSSSSSAAG